MVTNEQSWWPEWFRYVVNDADGRLRTSFSRWKQPNQKTIMEYLDESRLAGADHSELVGMFDAKVRDVRDNAPKLSEL